jgi:hypothetical protein
MARPEGLTQYLHVLQGFAPHFVRPNRQSCRFVEPP